jgi:hypothetical protein
VAPLLMCTPTFGVELWQSNPLVVVSLFSGHVRPARDLAHFEHLVASKYPLATNCLT